MKLKRYLMAGLCASLLLGAPAGAQDASLREVMETATPTARVRAFQHVRRTYPSLAVDLHTQLKTHYPRLEHHVVDALLSTWEAHPQHLASLLEKIHQEHGAELKVLGREVREELEASYPNFRPRLEAVLSRHGLRPTLVNFLTSYDVELLDQSRAEIRSRRGEQGWQPGRLRDLWFNGELGDGRFLPRLRQRGSERSQLARRLVELARRRAPALAADFTAHWLGERQALLQALQHEFPGAAHKVATLVEQRHPTLPGSLRAMVKKEGQDVRATLREELEARMPGFEERLRTEFRTRYPNLPAELRNLAG